MGSKTWITWGKSGLGRLAPVHVSIIVVRPKVLLMNGTNRKLHDKPSVG
jgi:hypothetical protein